ncbi:MAG TPA: alpha/beta fold hydrolase [Chlamydiales bacterium]|nr:alpha/beta fold hydrolase [Chlamydiales bacterium]
MLARTDLKKGHGLPLVFLHGLLGTAADWEAVCDHLPTCHCIGFDLPGHGRSPFLEEFQIDIPRFHLIGYSMGGRIALQYAAKHPEQIASLTLLSVHPGLATQEEKQNRLLSDTNWAKLLFELSIDDFLTRWYDQPLFQPFRPDLNLRKNQNIPALAASLLHYSLAHQPHFTLHNVLIGEFDTKFRALHANPLLIPNSGHMIHLENPKAVADIIQQRISQ